jgi:hypothetical protein
MPIHSNGHLAMKIQASPRSPRATPPTGPNILAGPGMLNTIRGRGDLAACASEPL